MKILVFHQPYPMGNYKLNQVIAEYFEKEGHEVYLLEQLNGRPANEDYIQQILNLDLDLCYYEMLDIKERAKEVTDINYGARERDRILIDLFDKSEEE